MFIIIIVIILIIIIEITITTSIMIMLVTIAKGYKNNVKNTKNIITKGKIMYIRIIKISMN